MKFSYTALTTDNKKATGVLDVESEEKAKTELHKMGVAIISVNEISDTDYEKLKKEEAVTKIEKGIQTYTFIAIDTNRQEVEGTIDAINDYNAYKRLKTEYKFKVNNLFLSNATEQEKEMAKGTMGGFEIRLQDELQLADAKAGKGKKENVTEEVSKELIKEIDNVIVNTKKVLEAHQELFSIDLIKEIQNTLGELERIRTSNNVKHITEVSNNLYELVSNPDKIENGAGNEDYKELTDKMGESALVKKEFELYKKAIKATGAKKLFKAVTERLKSLTSAKDEEVKKPTGTISKIKEKLHSTLEKISAKKVTKAKKAKSRTKLGQFFEKLNNYLKANTPALKKARARELKKTLKSIFSKDKANTEIVGDIKNEEEKVKKEGETIKNPTEGSESVETKEKFKKKMDFTNFFVEIDSFIGWLLSFYIIYFFLINFSLEKNIGLGREFVFKTLSTPLILNRTIVLLLIHFTLRLKNLHFQQNFLATLFLICFSLGVYTLLIVNF